VADDRPDSGAPPAAFPFLDHRGPIPFAHRGGAGPGIGENSLAAFARAVELGFRYLETDVHATSDGVLLAFHDRRLGRLTDTRGRIADLTHDELAGVRINGGDDAIPTMAELLASFPDAFFNIDVKEPNAIRPLAELLRSAGAVGRVCVSSFSDRRLTAMRDELGATLCTSAGPREAYRFWRASRKPGTVLPQIRAACLQLPPRIGNITVVDERLVAACRRAGRPLHVWTIDDPGEMRRLLDLGADGIMTDDLATLRQVLTDRGTWI
jgi:glycerophosphoryl diester phosphodiesterase